MCASHVYKRRKLPNSVALLSGDNGVGGTKGGSPASSSMIPKCSPFLVSRLAAQAEGSRDVEPPSNSVEGRHLCRKLPVTSARKLTSLGNGPDDCCSSSKPSMERASSSARVAGSGDSGECTSSGTLQTGPSSAQLVPGDVPGSPSSSLDFLGGDDPRFDMPCKVCGVKGSPLRMLICDLCDEAFHFSCCKARRLPEDEWYCRPCLRKKPKVLPETLSGQLFYIMSQKKKRRILREKLGPILSMLVDSDPYTSGVRIGKKFQAEVPEWTGPVPEYALKKPQSPWSPFDMSSVLLLLAAHGLDDLLSSGDDYLAKASSELDPREWGGSLNVQSLSSLNAARILFMWDDRALCCGYRPGAARRGSARSGTGFSVGRWSTMKRMRTTREPSAESGAGLHSAPPPPFHLSIILSAFS